MLQFTQFIVLSIFKIVLQYEAVAQCGVGEEIGNEFRNLRAALQAGLAPGGVRNTVLCLKNDLFFGRFNAQQSCSIL